MHSFSHRRSFIEKCGILIGCVLIANNIAFIPSIGAIYYLIMMIVLLLMLYKSSKMRVSGGMIWLYITCIISIILNDVPTFFHPYMRFGSFFMMTALLSPFVVSVTFTRFRIQTFATIMGLLQYVIVGSILFRIIGLGYEKGYFQGITNHSMVLGPFATLSALFCIYQLLANHKNRKRKIFYFSLLACSLFCVLQAASRTAFIGCIVSIFIFLLIYYHRNFPKYVKLMISIGCVLVLTFPLWQQYLDKLLEKNRGASSELSMDSREAHWNQRIKEFKYSPIIGIGFASVNSNSQEGSTFSDDGKVETGSSWLCILSMTGLCGFAGMLILYISSFVKLWRLRYDTPLLSSFLIAVLCFWVLHMIAEGYIYAAGSVLFFCVWLLIGIVYGISRNKQFAYELQYKLHQ